MIKPKKRIESLLHELRGIVRDDGHVFDCLQRQLGCGLPRDSENLE